MSGKGQPLTERQKRFADRYIELGSAEQAAVAAGYSEKYARALSYKMLDRPGIKAYIDERLKQLEENRIASAAEVMQYLTRVLRGEETEQVVVGGPAGAETCEKDTCIRDRLRAAELLGKRYSMFTDKLDLDVPIKIVINDDYGD